MIKALAALILLASLSACPHPIGEIPTTRHVVNCGKQAVTGQGIGIIPAVNSCLVGASATGCLFALIDPAKNITLDFISCLVRSRGAEFATAASQNPEDQLSRLAADNAAKFSDDTGITFSD